MDKTIENINEATSNTLKNIFERCSNTYVFNLLSLIWLCFLFRMAYRLNQHANLKKSKQQNHILSKHTTTHTLQQQRILLTVCLRALKKTYIYIQLAKCAKGRKEKGEK